MDNRNRKALKNRRGHSGSKKPEKQKLSVPELMSKAEEMIENMHPELAEQLYMKALEIEPQNTEVMDQLAALLLEMDDWERAKTLLETSMTLEPESSFSKYMMYGQLLEGKHALQCYQKGIELMLRQKQSMTKSGAPKRELRMMSQQIASAFCSVADIYLTDACFEESAEQECGGALEMALKYDKKNPEVYQTMASFKISQQNPEEALKMLTEGYNLWKDLEFDERPSYEFRHNTAKLFLELEQPRTATEIWESLLEEDDNIAEVYYHLALAYRKFNSQYARENLEQAVKLLKLCGDLPFLKEAQELMNEMKDENIVDQEVFEDKGEEDQDSDDDDQTANEGMEV